MKFKNFVQLFVFIFCLFIAGAVNAQTLDTSSDLNVVISPENPGPNEQVTLTLSSFITSLDRDTITWKVNGKSQKSGVGVKSISITTGGLNTTTSIDISVSTPQGEVITKNVVLKPTSVDLIWQADSYVPPFYKGKAMFSHQNLITFIAIPHIVSGNVEIPPKNLVYTWSLNGNVVENSSGYGKNTAMFVGSLISRPLDVSVNVETSSGGAKGFAETNVTPIDPHVILYQIHPLYGIQLQKALTNEVSLSDSREMTVIGVPFYFGVYDTASPDLKYSWSINGTSVGNPPNDTTEIFRAKDGVGGTSNIGLSVENSQKILQTGDTNFNLTFGQNKNNALQF